MMNDHEMRVSVAMDWPSDGVSVRYSDWRGRSPSCCEWIVPGGEAFMDEAPPILPQNYRADRPWRILRSISPREAREMMARAWTRKVWKDSPYGRYFSTIITIDEIDYDLCRTDLKDDVCTGGGIELSPVRRDGVDPERFRRSIVFGARIYAKRAADERPTFAVIDAYSDG